MVIHPKANIELFIATLKETGYKSCMLSSLPQTSLVGERSHQVVCSAVLGYTSPIEGGDLVLVCEDLGTGNPIEGSLDKGRETLGLSSVMVFNPLDLKAYHDIFGCQGLGKVDKSPR